MYVFGPRSSVGMLRFTLECCKFWPQTDKETVSSLYIPVGNFKKKAYKYADCLRFLYVSSCKPCHLVDNCVQYQYSMHNETSLHHLSARGPSKLLTHLAHCLLTKYTDPEST